MRALPLLLTLALSLFAFSAAAQDDVPPGRLAFVSDRTGLYQVYVANADGSDEQQITNGPYAAFLPLWSPDGERLLYIESTSDAALSEHPTLRLMLTDLDGGEPLEIARDPEGGFLMNPARYLRWSPDGERVVYGILTDDERGQHARFYVDALDGSTPVEVASPVRREDIAFVQFIDNDTLLLSVPFKLYRANLDGSEPEQLEAVGAPPALSPDRRKIAVVEGGDLMLYDVDGTNPVVVIEDMPGPIADTFVGFAYELIWSPDGEWLSGAVFVQERLSLGGTPEPTPETPLPREALFTARADGSDYTSFVAADLILSWSPQSTHIAYTIHEDDRTRVVVANPDGSDPIVVTYQGSSAQPAWQP